MTEVRIVGTARLKDHQAAVEILNRVCDIASGVEGVKVWEAFADDESGLVYLNEWFDSEQSVLDYESAVDAEGLRPQVAEAMEFQQLIVLSPIEDERLKAAFDSLGAVTVRAVASK